MATHPARTVMRRAHALLALALAVAQPHARATGGFDEEPLPPLADYLRLDQLPAKSIGQILAETSAPRGETAKINYLAELLALPKKPGAEALAAIDKMIAAARAEAASPLLNLLNDLRDVFAGPADAAESAAYLEWRIEQADRFGVSFAKDKAKPREPEPERKAPNKALIAEIERHLAKASPALKPHWAYLRGAVD